MFIPTKLFPVRLPEALLQRAKQIVLDRRRQGGVARLIRESLEATLDEMEKVPLSFEATFMRMKGRDPTLEERVACYGGRYKRQMKMGDPHYAPRDWFTSTECFAHYCSGQWDRSTTPLVRAQQVEWKRRGEALAMMPITPPGWDDDRQQQWSASPVDQAESDPPDEEEEDFELE